MLQFWIDGEEELFFVLSRSRRRAMYDSINIFSSSSFLRSCCHLLFLQKFLPSPIQLFERTVWSECALLLGFLLSFPPFFIGFGCKTHAKNNFCRSNFLRVNTFSKLLVYSNEQIHTHIFSLNHGGGGRRRRQSWWLISVRSLSALNFRTWFFMLRRRARTGEGGIGSCDKNGRNELKKNIWSNVVSLRHGGGEKGARKRVLLSKNGNQK